MQTENTVVLGSLEVNSNYTTYTAPAILPAGELKKMSFEPIPEEAGTKDVKENKIYRVTHNHFFGENIKRALSILRNDG